MESAACLKYFSARFWKSQLARSVSRNVSAPEMSIDTHAKSILSLADMTGLDAVSSLVEAMYHSFIGYWSRARQLNVTRVSALVRWCSYQKPMICPVMELAGDPDAIVLSPNLVKPQRSAGPCAEVLWH